MERKNIILCLVVVLISLMLFVLLSNNRGLKVDNKSISPNILYLTSPVNSFTGVVEKKEANSITVSRTTPHKLTYTFVINKNTSFLRPPVSVPFLFATPIPVKEKKYQFDDVVVGSTVTVSVTADLRLLKMPIVEAHNIFLSNAVNMFTGNIIEIKERSISFKTTKGEEIIVGVNDQTEISRYVFTPPQPNQSQPPIRTERLVLTDLKKDMQATVYTDQDILTGKNLTALRIDPIFVSSPPVLP